MLFTFTARLLVQFNSSINPIVYATTVPEFRKTIRKLRGKAEETDSLTHSQKSRNTQKSLITEKSLDRQKSSGK